MSASEFPDSVSLSWTVQPNRSLSPFGRKLWLCMIAMTLIPVACAMLMMGAWLVLPFAGLELGLLWFAFHVLGRHDADYEVLVVSGGEFRWERREGCKIESLRGNRQWAQVSRHADRMITLRYAGRHVAVGRMATGERREVMYRQMAGVFRAAC